MLLLKNILKYNKFVNFFEINLHQAHQHHQSNHQASQSNAGGGHNANPQPDFEKAVERSRGMDKEAWNNLTPEQQEQKKLEALDNFKKSDTLKENIKEAERMRDKSRLEKYKWMYNNFKTGDKYDIKHGDPEKEHAGNFNYGVMGRAAGLSEQELERFAGAYQKYGEAAKDVLNWQIPDKLTGSTYRSEFGGPMDIGKSSYGDDPVDQGYIREGIEWYDEYY